MAGSKKRRGARGILQRDGDLRLRYPTRRDEKRWVAWKRANAPYHGYWDALPPPGFDPNGPAAFEKYVASARTESSDRTLLFSGTELVGAFNLSQIFRGALQSAYLGYAGSAEHLGAGYMSRGLQLLLRHAFGRLALHRLEANVQPNNDRSIALAQSAGFLLEGLSPRYLKIRGRWRDHLRFALLREDWLARKD